MSIQETCYFFKLSLEIRLEIYKLALPSNKFYYCTSNDDFHGVEFGLLTTCKATYREAYPILISRNNFRLAYSIRNSLGEPSIPLDNLREVTFMWFHICVFHQHERESRFNLLIIQGLLKCPKVHAARIYIGVGDEDEACRTFESRYREEAVSRLVLPHRKSSDDLVK
ncbi:hypothetical protein B0O99DRAFT_45839 [Bisporella sp. PMI_857]|nr:hypothetical protein B0O99DRAFT_45839 [Bisporella sp. PMI_857]